MRRYKNKGGHGGIIAYEVGSNFIIIRFKDGSTYLYNDKAPGENHIEQMKLLAEKGKGLTTYVNKYVRENYAKKLND